MHYKLHGILAVDVQSKQTLTLFLAVVLFSLSPQPLRGQATSRLIPFNNVPTTIQPPSPGQTLTLQLWDAPTAGNQLYCENQTLDVTPGPDGVTGVITFDFGAGVAPPVPCPSGPPELKPGDFVSGQSRFLDVADTTGAAFYPTGAFPLGPWRSPSIQARKDLLVNRGQKETRDLRA